MNYPEKLVTIPMEVQRNLPTPVVHLLMQQMQLNMLGKSNVATDKDLIDIVRKQWSPSLYVLNYFKVDALPRQPFTRELTNAPPRSKYYETFLSTCVFFFAILLIVSLRYLLARGRLRPLVKNPRLATWLQFFIVTIPFVICVLDFPVKNYAAFAIIFNIVSLAIYAGCRMHRRLTRSASALMDSFEAANGNAAATVVRDLEAGQIDNRGTTKLSTTRPYNDMLAIYRSIVYISTAVCIFARDQPCWNNDFSKTRSFGTGLMDVGIGCFVICVGSLGPTANRPLDGVDRPLALRKAALQSAILTVCGLVKTVSVVISTAVRKVNYDEAWTEYGVHWNAFFSLAVARGLGATLELLVLPSWLPPILAAVMTTAAHEALLAAGLAKLVLGPGETPMHNRSTLIGQNREGLASIPGLVALYFAGLQLGRWTNQRAEDGDARARKRLVVPGRILALLAAAAALRPLLVASDGYPLLPESRRLMNTAYCAWLVTFSCFHLLCAWAFLEASQRLCGAKEPGESSAGSAEIRLTPIHLQQVDSTGLLYFLVSNLLTGLFNFVINRLVPNRESMDGAPCLLVVLVYTATAFQASRLASRWFSFRDLQANLMRRFWKA